MILNAHQYAVTLAQIDKFKQTLSLLARSQAESGIDPRLIRAEREGLESQLRDLQREVAEYQRAFYD